MFAVSSTSCASRTAVTRRTTRRTTTTPVSTRHRGDARLTVATASATPVQVTDDMIAAAKVPISKVKDTIGRGFIVVDIRSPEEWQEGSKSTWKKICLAVMDEEGNVELNPSFLAQIRAEFPNTLSRILLVCDDGDFRSEVAFKNICKIGYTQVKIIEGGSDAFFEAFPLTAADRRVWKLQDQPGEDLSQLVSGVNMDMSGFFTDRKY
jgi:rhodanese-related sulfurtransferase